MKKQKMVILTAIALVLVFAISGKIYKSQQKSEVEKKIEKNRSLLVRDYSITKGNKLAKVELVEFFDPACVTCGQFYTLVEKIMEKHKGEIKLVMRYAPFHAGSKRVVRVLEATRKQGKFFQTLEMLFKNQRYWIIDHRANIDVVWKLLPQVGVDLSKLQEDLNDPEIEKRVSQDIADTKTLGIHQTPEYFVNGKPLKKFGYNELKDLINSEL